MGRWAENSFWRDITARLAVAEAGTRFAPMRIDGETGLWSQSSTPGLATPPALLQGRMLVADVTDRSIRLYPLGLAGRFDLALGFTVGESDTATAHRIEYGIGRATLRGDGWTVEVLVSSTLPVLELALRVDPMRGDAARARSWVVWPGDGARSPIGAHEFRRPPSFEQDALIERNNSTAPDPLPLVERPVAGVAVRAVRDRIVVAVAADDASTATVLDAWELARAGERRTWANTAARLDIRVPDAPISRQLRYSVVNSLFSRSVDGAGRDIFVHGRRDRGYADAGHLHQSYQMHLVALAAGEGASVRDDLLAYCALQREDGWIEMAPRPVSGHSRYVGHYTSSHLLLAAERYLAWTADAAFFDVEVSSEFDRVARTVAERVDRAADDVLAHRYLGLAEPCGWADAWNPEVRAQGQASAAAVLGLRAWGSACRALGRSAEAARFLAAADAMTEAMRRELLDPQTGIVAEHCFDDRVEGGTRQDFWSHTQIWSALAGIVTDGRGLDLANELCLDRGMSIAPESAFDADYVGESTDDTASLPVESTATWLMAGWPEVTHLYALAELQRGRPDVAFDTIASQLPEALHAERPECSPFFYAEKYLYPGNRPWLCTWAGDPSLVEVVLTGFLGVEVDTAGVRVLPRLPTAWRGARATARFMVAGCAVELELTPDLDEGRSTVDGVPARAVSRFSPRPGGRLRVAVSSR